MHTLFKTQDKLSVLMMTKQGEHLVSILSNKPVHAYMDHVMIKVEYFSVHGFYQTFQSLTVSHSGLCQGLEGSLHPHWSIDMDCRKII